MKPFYLNMLGFRYDKIGFPKASDEVRFWCNSNLQLASEMLQQKFPNSMVKFSLANGEFKWKIRSNQILIFLWPWFFPANSPRLKSLIFIQINFFSFCFSSVKRCRFELGSNWFPLIAIDWIIIQNQSMQMIRACDRGAPESIESIQWRGSLAEFPNLPGRSDLQILQRIQWGWSN